MRSAVRMRRYVLYVFELRDSVGKLRRVPARMTSEPYVYVGYTAKRRRERLREHRIGHYVADRRWAPHYGKTRGDLWAGWQKYATQAEVLAAESQLAASLQERGYTVVNKTGSPLSIAPKVKR